MYVHVFNIPEKNWTVGFFRPDGEFCPVEDFEESNEAAAFVHYLNGGSCGNLEAIADRLSLLVNLLRTDPRRPPDPVKIDQTSMPASKQTILPAIKGRHFL
ncbi:MAG TPA: hypothetical protein VGG71_10715 [Chitinophagaceae bacterium]